MEFVRKLFNVPKEPEAAATILGGGGRPKAGVGRVEGMVEPDVLEECAACGNLCSQDDFVKKLKESAIRNLEHVPNVDKVVAAKKMCRKCFLGKSGVDDGDDGGSNEEIPLIEIRETIQQH